MGESVHADMPSAGLFIAHMEPSEQCRACLADGQCTVRYLANIDPIDRRRTIDPAIEIHFHPADRALTVIEDSRAARGGGISGGLIKRCHSAEMERRW